MFYSDVPRCNGHGNIKNSGSDVLRGDEKDDNDYKI